MDFIGLAAIEFVRSVGAEIYLSKEVGLGFQM